VTGAGGRLAAFTGIFGTGDPRQQQRGAELRRFVVDLARQDFDRRHPAARSEPVLVLCASYLEVQNIGPVLKGIPDKVRDLGVTTLVVVDGGDDGTEAVAEAAGALWARFPVNLGHGVALRFGYELAERMGARYVVTIDADGQNDPAEIPQLLAPILDDEADFVIASRRLGLDHTSDQFRRSGVVVYSEVINRITGQHLTDTSNGYRALRIEVLTDIRGRLQQDQYQTAEVIITAARRGWRLGEVPTVWHPRASGTTKKGRNVFFGARYAGVIARTWWRERHEVAHRTEA
jgi:hypothetical protein